MVKAKDTKGALLQTAMNLIWAHNYGTVSVDEICRAAGAQKGSFYHFFSSKHELAKAAMENLWSQLRPQLDHIFSPQVPGLERLRNYTKFSYEAQKAESEKLGFMVGCPFTTLGSERSSEDDGLTEVAWEILLRFKKYFVIALRDACEEGTIQLIDYEASANELFLHDIGCHSACRLSRSLEPLDDLFERWMGILTSPRNSKSGENKRQAA